MDGGTRVKLRVYYTGRYPELGLVEITEDMLSLVEEIEEAGIRIYVLNATTTTPGMPGFEKWVGETLLVLTGWFETHRAVIDVHVYGAPVNVYYNAEAEIRLPNGTVIPMRTRFWTLNPSIHGYLYASASTGYPTANLHGATITLRIPELNLTVVGIPG